MREAKQPQIFEEGIMRSLLKLSLLFLFTVILSLSLGAQIQLVESVPVETNLGIEETGRTLDVWLDMIKGAQKTIDIEIFYLSAQKGEPLEEVINALKDASSRSVSIRIIADAKFANVYPETLNLLDSLSNIEVERIELFNKMDGVQHSKYFIVDGEEIFLGSQNFDWRSLKHIHELGIRIHNKRLAEFITKIFNLDWDLSKNTIETKIIRNITLPQSTIIDQKNPVQINWQDEWISIYPTFTPKEDIFPGMPFDETQLLDLIGNATEKIYIQLLSYNPADHGEYYPALENALRSAALRGVQVKLLVSDWNKSKPGVGYLKSLQVLPNIEVKFSTLPQYSGGFIPFARVEHCKYMVVDDSLTWIGTANWAKNYFYASRNLGLVIKGKSVNSIVQKVFLKSWNGDYTYFIDPSKEYQVPRIGE